MIAQFIFALGLISGSDESPANEDEFTYYVMEFTSHELPKGDPMAQLITDRLVEAVFNTSSADIFAQHIRQLKSLAKSNPAKLERFISLDARLNIAFTERLKKAEHKRWLYTAGGALAGAVIGFPVGKFLAGSTSMGSKIIFLTVPAGVLAGAGAGYLLGSLIEVPDYAYESGSMTRDLGLDRQQIEELENDAKQ